ncbi:MAG: Gfo/Idh/MocA family protein [Bacillota bacterium]
MINVALLSKWHVHADDYAFQAGENEHLRIKKVWDENSERGQKWADELGVTFHDNLNMVLSDPEIDAVIVDTPTNLHKEVILAAAHYKKHIFTEKVLALSVEDCEEILAAVKENNVQLMVSLPRLTENYYLYAQEVVNQGLLGKLTMVRCRVAHDGAIPFEGHPNGWLPKHFFDLEACGGGALIDLGAHAIYLTNRLAGKATAVTARLQKTLGYEVDDNAVVIVEYESGALGTLEVGFISSGCPFQLELYGTEGTLLIEDTQIRIKSKQLDVGWNEPEELRTPLPMPMEQWVNAIQTGQPLTITAEDAVNLTLINEAAAISNKERRSVEISEIYVKKTKSK